MPDRSLSQVRTRSIAAIAQHTIPIDRTLTDPDPPPPPPRSMFTAHATPLNVPFLPKVSDWYDAAVVIDYYRARPEQSDQLQALVMQWWHSYLASLRQAVAKLVAYHLTPSPAPR